MLKHPPSNSPSRLSRGSLLQMSGQPWGCRCLYSSRGRGTGAESPRLQRDEGWQQVILALSRRSSCKCQLHPKGSLNPR